MLVLVPLPLEALLARVDGAHSSNVCPSRCRQELSVSAAMRSVLDLLRDNRGPSKKSSHTLLLKGSHAHCSREIPDQLR